MKVKPVLFLMLLIILFSSCSENTALFNSSVSSPLAYEGKLDLSAWNLEQGHVALDGQWYFFWNELLTPEEIETRMNNSAHNFIELPCSWNNIQYGEKKLSAEGYATFYLEIIPGQINSSVTRFGIKIDEINTAYKLWINNELILTSGTTGRSRETSVPKYMPVAKIFYNEEEVIKLTVQVSNFHFAKSGIWKSILFGREEEILSIQSYKKAVELFLTGIILIMGVYNFAFFFMNKNLKETLYFALFCIIVLLRILFSGEMFFMEIFPETDWGLAVRLQLMMYYLGPPLFLLFIKELYPKEADKKVVAVFLITGVLLYIAILIIPALFYDYIYNFYQFIIYAGCLYCLVVLIIAAAHKKDSAKILLTGFLVFIISVVNDILYSLFIIRTSYIAPLGFLFFIFAEVAIYIKFIRAEKELKIQQEKLVQAEKLASLGTIITGIAHEINNPNNSILITSKMLKSTWKNIEYFLDKYTREFGEFSVRGFDYEELKTEYPESLERIINCSNKINRIVLDLKNFARKDKLELKDDVDIIEVINSALRLLNNKIKASTENLQVNLNSGIPKFKGNSQQLEQVIINLIQNSCEALEDKSKSLIITAGLCPDEKEIHIRIKDEGRGIEKNELEKITDPFYTTKADRGGTGLGLYISGKIIKQHNGSINFSSVPGEGTEVTIKLPRENYGK